jgi:tRNA-intron endonuclease
MLELSYGRGRVVASDSQTREALRKGFYGVRAGKEVSLGIEESLYLIDVRNAICIRSGKAVTFSDLAAGFWRSRKFMARYFTYKDWRERGLVAISPGGRYVPPNRTPTKAYPSSSLRLPSYDLHGVFFKTDLMTVVGDEKQGKEAYEKYWLGQYGSYKAPDRGGLDKLDVYETLFLMEKGALSIGNATRTELLAAARAKHADFQSLYGVYKDWREKGYVVKTGFKFGTHFRVYFPGAKPARKEDRGWAHSRHVIHVFPKDSRLLISELARVIRVAHSVRKTFILAVPGRKRSGRAEIDFILYHRHGGEADNPRNAKPRYAMLSLSEEEYIGGSELASAINEAKKRRMELLLAIADRETAVTYYKVTQISLPRSRHDYFEIDWFQP